MYIEDTFVYIEYLCKYCHIECVLPSGSLSVPSMTRAELWSLPWCGAAQDCLGTQREDRQQGYKTPLTKQFVKLDATALVCSGPSGQEFLLFSGGVRLKEV